MRTHRTCIGTLTVGQQFHFFEDATRVYEVVHNERDMLDLVIFRAVGSEIEESRRGGTVVMAITSDHPFGMDAWLASETNRVE